MKCNHINTTNKVTGVTYRTLLFLKMVAFLVILLPLAACALSGKAVEGRVLEAGTNKPIPDAIVEARWIGYVSGFADSQTTCYHVMVATTDANGHYSMPAWRKEITEEWQKNLIPQEVKIDAYKKGYEWAGIISQDNSVEYLKVFSGTQERLFRVTAGAVEACGSGGDSEKNLLPFYQKAYADALPLAVTKNDKYILSDLLLSIEMLQMPYLEAEKRRVERDKAIRHEK
jgi:hypothetical protein